jgi:cold shock CspA family protein
VQGTVWAYDAVARAGSVVLDDGVRVRFGPEALEGTGLRMLRPGQRVRLEVTRPPAGAAGAVRVTRVQILTLRG